MGGRNTFRPSELAPALPRLGLTSIGAAGTFVARTTMRPEAIRRALGERLPFSARMMIVPSGEVLKILRTDPVGVRPTAQGVRKFVSVAADRLPSEVRLPIEIPGPGNWGVRVLATDGRFAMGLQRRLGTKLIYANDVVERAFGVETTTRWWETLQSVGQHLNS